MAGRQAYDAGRNRLVYSHVFGPPDDKAALWRGFDWQSAISVGEQAAHQDYSGEFGFVDTHMYWPITHMVAPASDAVDCAECHAKQGRMAGIAGVFMRVTDSMNATGILGRLLVLAVLAGVLIHGAIQVIAGRKGGDIA